MQIEVIDVAAVGLSTESPSEEAYQETGRNVLESFRNTGFAYLKNHGISEKLQADTYSVSREFFSLDTESKMKYERFVRTGYNGYTPIGGENSSYANSTVDLVDFKECYDLHFLGEDYPDDLLPAFSQQMELFSSSCTALANRLLRALDSALDTGALLSNSHKCQLRTGGCTELRVLNYPPVPADVQPNTVRCASHTDYGTFTLLFQDNMGGLEVETASGVWIPATPIPGTILVNIGDMMETWTSGKLKATYHRVRIPESQLYRNNPRQSLVYFVQPDEGVIVSPLDGSTEKYKPVDAGQFLRDQFAATYPTFSRYLRS